MSSDQAPPKNYVSNSPESIRMFERPWMEALSRVYWWVPLLVYLPLIVALTVHASGGGIGALPLTIWMFAGIVVWSLTEYLLHRFVFHYHPSSDWGKRLHFLMHGVHHDYPSDAKRLVMPPAISMPLALLFYGLFAWILPPLQTEALMVGFTLGYLVYDLTHYALHHAQFRSGWLYRLKRYHMRHHYADPSRSFGVSSPLWDQVFGSTERRLSRGR
ncbi:MAG: fatty acid hydroxylase [Hydrocarboniphaga sp.]|uniref:sterol desaturase family protein n=1 Tax=Hydrocarboniphaga sp. TaxID=2033016 RepID=UPI00262B7489|nr:sterol desaturase family protein [Hydrocarboniphaga sp.]MDB5968136.1 fatty acid hydroxylase [Hydrocarboniphaga sp.]